VYVVATRAGTLCLFAMFALLGVASGTLDFDGWPAALASPVRDAVFVLGLCGFGLKAGVMPLHIWLPGAHANAPSHVSALMSGVLIKTGIYGLVRLTASSAAPPLWWGYLLIGAGAVSGVLGVAFAIGQHDLKRLLAYHSVENIGIICMGLGVAVLGRSLGSPALIALGIAGALLHVWNHGLFKALLFLSAGSVLHATGTREIDRLGGVRPPHAVHVSRVPGRRRRHLRSAAAERAHQRALRLPRPLPDRGADRADRDRRRPSVARRRIDRTRPGVHRRIGDCLLRQGIRRGFHWPAATRDVERAHEAGPAMLLPMAILGAACLFIGVGGAAGRPGPRRRGRRLGRPPGRAGAAPRIKSRRSSGCRRSAPCCW